MMTEIKKYFPALDSAIYLDTASCGLVPAPVLEWRRDHDLNLSGSVSGFRANAKEVLNSYRENIASFFGAKSTEAGLVPNFSIGFNLVLENFKPGSKVLILDDEYPSVSWPIYSRGFETLIIGIEKDLENHIGQAIKKHHPDIFIFSIVQWISGIKIDLKFIQKLKKEFPDLILIADGTQYLGTEDFSFEKSGIDILISSCYKWLTAGFGSGILFIKEEIQKKLPVKTIGFNSADTFEDKAEDVLYMRKFEPGHLDTLNFGSLNQSLDFYTKIGKEKIFNSINQISKSAQEYFVEKNLLSFKEADRYVFSTIFNIKGDETLFEKLKRDNIICSQRGPGIRISFHYYNDESDLEKLKEILH